MYSQLNNASKSTVRQAKMNEKYQIDLNLFAEVGVNWTAGAGNTFSSWYSQDLEKVKCMTVCNEYDKARTSRHQPGGTAVAVRGAMSQCLRKIQVQGAKRTT